MGGEEHCDQYHHGQRYWLNMFMKVQAMYHCAIPFLVQQAFWTTGDLKTGCEAEGELELLILLPLYRVMGFQLCVTTLS